MTTKIIKHPNHRDFWLGIENQDNPNIEQEDLDDPKVIPIPTPLMGMFMTPLTKKKLNASN